MANKMLVIGNGVTVNSDYIQKNEHDCVHVVRMNDFELDGQRVGERTTIWAVNTSNIQNKTRARNRINKLNKKDIKVVICGGGGYKKVSDSLKIYTDAQFEKIEVAAEPRRKVQAVIQARPTIGLVILRYMIDVFQSNIIATGFDLIQNADHKCLHYWGKLDGKRHGQWYPHDKNKELLYLQQLQKEGVVFV
jgi:hypothetical protein